MVEEGGRWRKLKKEHLLGGRAQRGDELTQHPRE